MPFVPAIFKALAREPAALVPAWLQARALYDDPRAAAAASRLVELARPRLAYRPSPAVREAAAPFAADLPSLLLIVTSLGLSLDGVLPLREPPARSLPPPAPLPPTPVPEQRDEDPLYSEIRDSTAPSTCRASTRRSRRTDALAESWAGIGPFFRTPKGARLVAAVAAAAEREAGFLPRVRFLRGRGSTARARPVPHRAPAQPRVRARGGDLLAPGERGRADREDVDRVASVGAEYADLLPCREREPPSVARPGEAVLARRRQRDGAGPHVDEDHLLAGSGEGNGHLPARRVELDPVAQTTGARGQVELGQQDGALEPFSAPELEKPTRSAGPARSGRSPPRAARPVEGRSRRRRAGPRCPAGTAVRAPPPGAAPCRPARAWTVSRRVGPRQHRAVGCDPRTASRQAVRAVPLSRSSTTVALAAVHHASRRPSSDQEGSPRTIPSSCATSGGSPRRRSAARLPRNPRAGASETTASGPRGGTQRPHSRDGPPAPSVRVARLSVRGRQPAWLAKTSVPVELARGRELTSRRAAIPRSDRGPSATQFPRGARHTPPRRRAPRPRRGRAPRRPAAPSRRWRRGHGRSAAYTAE